MSLFKEVDFNCSASCALKTYLQSLYLIQLSMKSHAKSLATGYCVSRKGTLLDELNRASGVVQSPLTSQWKATQNETYLNQPPKAVKDTITNNFKMGNFPRKVFLDQSSRALAINLKDHSALSISLQWILSTFTAQVQVIGQILAGGQRLDC